MRQAFLAHWQALAASNRAWPYCISYPTWDQKSHVDDTYAAAKAVEKDYNQRICRLATLRFRTGGGNHGFARRVKGN